VSNLRKAAEQALKVLESIGQMDMHPEEWAATVALRAALAEPDHDRIDWAKAIERGGYMTRDEIAQTMQDTAGSDWGTESHFQRFATLFKKRMIRDGWRQCAEGQKTTQFCGELEAAVEGEREIWRVIVVNAVAAAVNGEREACAKEATAFGREHPVQIQDSIRETAKSIAKCIRERDET
jgi:hypothetical protein